MGHSPWSWVWRGALAVVVLTPVVWRLFHKPLSSDIQIEPDAIVLQYMAWGNPQQLEVERDIIRKFNDKCRAEGKPYRVKLFMPPGTGYAQKLRVMLASGTAPDVMRVDHYDFPSLAPKGYFYDLTPLAQRDEKAGTFRHADFHPAAMKENYHDGRLYGLNVMFGPPVCYYNKDLFAKAGLPDPYDLWKRGQWTWEAFVHAAKVLTERDSQDRVIRYGFLLPGAQGGAPPNWSWFIFVWGQGGNLLSEPEPGKPRRSLLDSPEVIRAFQEMRDLRYKHRVAPTPADGALSAFTFESGKIAMEFQFSGSAPRYRSIKDFEWDIVPTPARVAVVDGKQQVIPYALVKGNQLCVSARSKHPEAAWEFVKYATSYETEKILYGETHRRNIPTRKKLLSSYEDYIKAELPPFHIDIYDQLLDNAMELPIDYSWPAWTSEAARYIEKLFVDEKSDTADVLRSAKLAVDRVLETEHARVKRYLEPQEGGQ